MQLHSTTLTLGAIAATFGAASAANNPCLTQEACEGARQKMGIESFYIDEYPTKGCFAKNGKAFFSVGTDDEMSVDELSGVQKRIWCDGGDSNNLFDVDAADSTTNAAAGSNANAAPSSNTNAAAGSNTKVAAGSNTKAAADSTTKAAAGSSDSGATIGMMSFSLGVTAAAVMAASHVF